MSQYYLKIFDKKNNIIILLGGIQLLALSSLFLIPYGNFPEFQSSILEGSLTLSWFVFLWMMFSMKNVSHNASSLKWMIIFGISFRIIMYSLPPIESNDYLRYLFDGKIMINGWNPYSVRPLDLPELMGHRIPKPEIKTIYPPLAELLFFLSAWFGKSLWIWKAGILMADLGCAFLLIKLLKLNNLPLLNLVGYLWNPLVLKEFTNSGHVDIWALFFVLCSLYFWQKKQVWIALFTIACATLIKVIPLIFAVPWLFQVEGIKKRFQYIFIFIIFITSAFAFFIPYHPFGSLLQFFSSIHGTGLLFNTLQFFLSAELARIILTAFGGFLVYYLVVEKRRYTGENTLRGFELFFVVFMFSSMGFPWYLAMVVPLIVFFQMSFFMIYMALAQLIYYFSIDSIVGKGLLFCSGVFLFYSIVIKREFSQKINLKLEKNAL